MKTTFNKLILLVLLLASGCTTFTPWPTKSPTAGSSSTSSNDAGFASAASDTQSPKPPAITADQDKANREYNDEMGKAVGAEQVRDFAEARNIYLQLIKTAPQRYEAFHHLGLVCDAQHKSVEAQEYYATAIRLQPKNAELIGDLGYSYFLQGKLDKAEASIRQAIAMQPAKPRYHNNLGLVLGNQKKYDAAWQEFRTAGGDAQAFYNLAFIYASQNDFRTAKTCFQKALSIDPSNENAQRALRTFELAEKDPDSLIGFESTSSDGRRWVAYDENSSSNVANKPPPVSDGTTNQVSRSADGTHRVNNHQFQPPASERTL